MTISLDRPLLDARDPAVRLESLCDSGSLVCLIAGDGVLVGMGALDGVDAVLFATDPRVQGGAMCADGCAAIASAYEIAMERRLPIIGVWQSGGARLTEGVASLDGVGQVFAAMTLASGVIPQISLVLGPAAGGAAYGPALTDVVISAPDGRVFVTGPDVVRSVTGEDVDMAGLGGPDVTGTSGVAHLCPPTLDAAITATREVVGLLSRAHRAVPVREAVDPGSLLPAEARRAYDVRPIVKALLDAPPVELQPKWAPNVVTALGRLGGRPVGVVATNPLRMGGCLTAASSDKAARFVRLCDAFGIPLVVLVDVPGYLPGLKQETDGVVRRGAKLLHAFAACKVPRITIVTRKAYGGAYIAMNSKSLGATKVYAWAGAEVDVMNATAAVRILRRRELAAVPAEQLADAETAFAAEHARTTGGLSRALELKVVDAIIEPAETRVAIIEALAHAPHERARLTNIPL
ncbi:MAG TPA: carboxyl transferase domain-containing protein [Mycobacteriales bacterium]|nr:carboxyl transferase domain-containing protein [Mycobacteriales bacterium]